MAIQILYFLALIIFMPFVAMEKVEHLSIVLGAPEYWAPDGTQCDLDEKGEPCPVGPRNQLLESRYVNVFPKLREYLEKNENKLQGFDLHMFKLLQNCLGFSCIHRDSTGNFEEQKGIEKEIETIFINEYSPGKVIDALYISRLAGLNLIERLALKTFREKKDHRGRLIRLEDVYPSFESLDEIGPDQSYENISEALPIFVSSDEVSGLLNMQSNESEYKSSDSESEESDESESQDRLRNSSHSIFASLFAWIKSYLPSKQVTIPSNECKELMRYKALAFPDLKFKKQPDSWFQKLKSWVSLILWN